MAAFNFPNSPSTNDIHNENGVSFKWNGTVWKKIGTVANQLAQLGVTGISTFTGDVKFTGATSGRDILWDKSADQLKVNDNTKISLGTGLDFELFHDGSNSYIKDAGTGSLKIQGTNLHIESAAGEAFVMCTADGNVELYYDNSKKLETYSSGVEIHGTLQMDDNKIARFGNDGDLQIYHTGSHSHVSDRGGTGNLQIESNNVVAIKQNDNESYCAKFFIGAGSELYYNNAKKFETSSYGTWLGDNSRITLGGSAGTPDCHFYADSSNTNLQNITGDLIIKSNSDGDKAIVVKNGAATEIYFDNAKKIETTSSGVSVTGHVFASSNVYSDKLVSTTQSNSHSMYINARNAVGTEATLIKGTIGGAVELNYNTYKKFETKSNGVAVAGQVDCTAGGVLVDDNYSFSAGTSGDLLLYHNGSNSYLANSTGNLMITGNNSDKIHIRAHASKQEIVCFPSAGVQIFYNDSKKFETTNTGVDVQGNIKATGSGTDVTIKPADGLINFGMDGRTSFVTGENSCYIFSGSGASGTIPAGTLILQARSNVDRDIVFVTGSTPAERFRVKGDGTHTISTPMVFAYTPGTTQGLTDATWTKNTWLTSEDIDTDGAFSSSRFTVPSGKAGTYFIAVSTNLYSNNNNMRDARSVIYKNGSIYARSYNMIMSVTSSGLRHFTAQNQCIATLAAGDYIENYIYCDVHSGALYMSSDSWGTRGNYMLIYRIG